jgi:hypothetical protein
MKRSLLDIAKKVSIKKRHALLKPIDMNDSIYWIFEATGWKYVDILREIEYRDEQDRLLVYINTQSITPRDYITEQGPNGLLVKFIKSKFEYELDTDDYVQIEGDIEKYP